MGSQPFEIDDERGGGASRLTLALIMMALLGVATAVAVGLASGGQARRTPDLTGAEFGVFEFGVPQKWKPIEIQAVDGNDDAPPGLRFEETGGYRRRLTITEVSAGNFGAIPPKYLGVRAAVKLGLPLDAAKQAGGAERAQIERHGAALVAKFQIRYGTGDGELLHRAFAVATVDGRRHLVIDLIASTYASKHNRELIDRLVSTIDDKRYTVAPLPLTIDGVTAEPIDGLIALRRASDEADEKLVFVPSRDTHFMLLHLLPQDLTEPFDLLNARIAGASDEIDEVPVNMLTALDPSLQTTPDARLRAAMYWRFWRATGQEPTLEFGQSRLLAGGKHLHELVLNQAVSLPTFKALFGVKVTDTEAVLIEMIAEPAPRQRWNRGSEASAKVKVQEFARQIATTLHPTGPGDAKPGSESAAGSENPAESSESVDPPAGRADDKEADAAPAPPTPGDTPASE